MSGLAQGFESFRDLGALADYGRAESVVDEAVAWLEDRPSDGPPFFLWVHFLDPHLPYRSGGDRNPDELESSRDGYRREVAYLDGVLERVDFLRGAGPSRPRVTLLTSDHGEELGDHGGRGHGYTLYREVWHVPLILHLPDGSSGEVVAPLARRDLFGLVLEATAGVSVPGWAARRARPVRRASLYAGDRSLVCRLLCPYHAPDFMHRASRGGRAAIRTGRGELLEHHDLERDPAELHNRVGEAPDAARELIDLHRRGLRYWADREEAAFTEADLERLRGLGYVE